LVGLGECDLVLFDPSAERCAEVQSELGVAAVDSYEAMLDAGVDALLVCSPPNLHVAQAMRAAERGCALFIEKPLSHSLDGLGELVATVARHRFVCRL
jgi:predicted dehydrogenase